MEIRHSAPEAPCSSEFGTIPFSLSCNNGGRQIRRPRVLIVANMASWIIGRMAFHIMERFADQYEFWFMTDKIINLRPDVVRALVPTLDFTFPLTDKAFHLLRRATCPDVVPSILWVHHITTLLPPMKEALAGSDEWIVCTPEARSEVSAHCPQEKPTTVVLHGVDLERFRRVSPQRQRLHIPKDAFVVGFVGSRTSNEDEGRKGLDTLIAALLRSKNNVPNLHVAFLGLGWDAEVAQLSAAGISSNYCGFLPETRLAEFYSSIDVYVMTSRVEGGPCTVLESMACETPVVATRVGLVPRTIRDGENGFATEIGDDATIAARIALLASSPELRKVISTKARATVEQRLSWPEVLAALEQPLARMASLSQRKADDPPFRTGEDARTLNKAVVALDGILFPLASWWKGVVRFPVACRTIKACLETSTIRETLRGAALATRLSYRPRRNERVRNTL